MSPHTNRTVLLGMFAGVILGVVAGLLIPDIMLLIGVIGRLFINALQVLLLPLIPALIIVGVAGLGHASKIGRAAGSTVIYFAATTAIAVVIGTVLVLALQPGGSAGTAGAFIPDMVTRARSTSFTDIFSAFIPDNLLGSIGSGQYLGLVVLSLVFGGVLCAYGSKGRVVVDFFRAIAEVGLRIVSLLLYAAPVGLFALVGTAVARNPQGIEAMGGNLLMLTLVFVAALILHGVVVLPLILHLFGHRNPAAFAGKTAPALTIAFGTASSSAALPVTFMNVVDDSGVDARAGSLVLPLGAVMNANGTALYLAIAAIFTAQVFGISLNVFQIVAVGILSIVLSLGTAGVPGAALFSLAVLFSALSFPIEAYGAIGLLVVVDWLFDRGRALLNVWGDAVGAAVIGESFEFKTARASRTVASDYEPSTGDRDRDRRPSRRDRESEGRGPRREPREGRDSRRSPREERTGERKPRVRSERGERPERASREDRPARSERAPREERPVRAERAPREERPPRESTQERRDEVRPPRPPREGRPASAEGAEQPRPQRRQRSDSSRPSRRESDRSSRREQRPPREPQPAEPEPATSEDMTEERARLAAQMATQRQNVETRGPVEPVAETEKIDRTERTEQLDVPEIRRRPLPSTPRPERSSEQAAEPERESREVQPEPERELERRRETRPEPRPEPPARPEPPSRSEQPPSRQADREELTPSSAEREEREPAEDRPYATREPRLHQLLSELPASRAREEAEEKADQPAEVKRPREEREEAGSKGDEERQTSYGRGRSRRGGRSSGSSSSKPEAETPQETPEPKEEYTVDEVQTFGRGRRRRTR